MMNKVEAAAAARVTPVGYIYRCGCDAPDTHQVLYAADVPGEVISAAPSPIPAIRQCLTRVDFDRLAEETGGSRLDATPASYYGWRYDRAGLDRLLALAQERKPGLDRQATAQREKNRRDNADLDARRRRHGLCPHCGTYCHGDCRSHDE